MSPPLTDLLKGKNKKENIIWNDNCEQAFNILKNKLTKSPVLYAPDYSKEFIMQTDGAGIVLAQKFDDEEHPILFLSKKFTQAKETTVR